jgi:hypothetical protein
VPHRRTYNIRGKAQVIEAGFGQGLRKGGLLVRGTAQRYAPVLTGRMMRGVNVSEPRKVGTAIIVRIGPNVDYAKYSEEEPYVSRRKLGAISQAKNARMPWLKPALEAERSAAMNLIKASIKDALGRAKTLS